MGAAAGGGKSAICGGDGAASRTIGLGGGALGLTTGFGGGGGGSGAVTTGTSRSGAGGTSAATIGRLVSGGTGGDVSGGGCDRLQPARVAHRGGFIAIWNPLAAAVDRRRQGIREPDQRRHRRRMGTDGNRQRQPHSAYFVAVAASASSDTLENPAALTAPSRSINCAYWIVRSPRT